ncbi:toxin-antitoxin system YwqK family antitoxin [Croceimicrobium hydrocarbonivorans]|uniref:Toxin-antitoxin system YwqK family antitoxin n=1 Tax=Croceimicrobium hydrocarbonivorans TaxID=2761580 RepID=A0A7H0VE61_9FLAO|nr:toxin-antitoxin system YwqK family antitoxin [Croceimicrobium hydrocarbonivorans]QNR24009.1 toxin-antitoxin system YwqK family antitoxin [Croceimicrobium hydrocarbonivorans]
MKKIALLCLILFPLIMPGQENLSPTDAQGRRHGLWQKLHDNGKIRYVGSFDHGTPVDTFKYYFENGQLQTLNVFRGKSGNCMSFQYGEGKILAAQGLYANKQKDSVWTYFNQEGDVIARITFKNGVQNGPAIKYHTNGKPAESVDYKNGKKSGPWVQYYESGHMMSQGQYVDDNLEGEVTYFYSNGKPRSRGHYKGGLMVGTWYFFTEDLKLDYKEVWKNGRKVEGPKEKNKEGGAN